MRPPYRPGHVERVAFSFTETKIAGRTLRTPDAGSVIARCSCTHEPLGEPHRLGAKGTCAALIDDLNRHRATYIEAVLA